MAKKDEDKYKKDSLDPMLKKAYKEIQKAKNDAERDAAIEKYASLLDEWHQLN